jgi:hypothetical protein
LSHSRFELGFTRHRKVFRLGDAAFRLWASAIDYSREQRTDGVIEPADLVAIPRGTAGAWKPAVAAELVAAGLWHKRDGGGWQIHDFLDWQDSSVEANRKREQARERMRRVRANSSRTNAEPSPTDRTRSPDPPSDSEVSDPEATTDQRARDPESPLQARAASWLRDPQTAAFADPNPQKWPESTRLVAVLAEVFGGSPQPIRSCSDPRMRVLLTHWSEGRTTDELEQAIRGAGRDEHLLKNPQLQTLTTVLRDANQVDRFTRLLTVAPVVSVRPGGGDRAADGLNRQLARVAQLKAAEAELERKALP